MASDVSPVDTVQLDYGLSLVPRLKFVLSFRRADKSVKVVDEWHLKEAIRSLLRSSATVSVADSDLILQKEREPQKKRREEPVAWGTLFVWDIEGLLRQHRRLDEAGKNMRQAVEWGKSFVIEKLQGVELNVSGLKVRCEAGAEEQDDFEVVKRSWEDFDRPERTGYFPRNINVKPDTLIVKAVPSRWFAEPRVSSKASILVTHTIFSRFGMIRNLEVNGSETGISLYQEEKFLPTLLLCEIRVQYETFSSFALAMKSLCGRALQKEGTSFKANYVLSWDKDGHFLQSNVRKRKFEKERLQDIGQRQLAFGTYKAEITCHNATSEQIELARRSATHVLREGYHTKKVVSGELRRGKQEMLAVEDDVLKEKFRKSGYEQYKQDNELQDQRFAEMAKDASKEDGERHFVEVEQYSHSCKHLLEKSGGKTPKTFKEAECDADAAFDIPGFRDKEEERWPLESTTTDGSLTTCRMLEQAAFKLLLLPSNEETNKDDETRIGTGYSFKPQLYIATRLLSKVVQNS